MENPPLRLLAAFQQETDRQPQWLVHLEDREMWVAAEPVSLPQYTVIVPDMQARIVFDRSSARRRRTTRNRPLPRWGLYLAGAIGELSRNDLELSGAVIVIAGDEPAGPRYEYALGMAFAALWYTVNEQPYHIDELIHLMDTIRKDFIDV